MSPGSLVDFGRLLAAIYNTGPAPPNPPIEPEDFYPLLRDDRDIPTPKNQREQLEQSFLQLCAAYGAN